MLRARSILAADIAAKTTTPLTPEQQAGLEKLNSAGNDETPVTELLSMASATGSLDPLLVSVKAVEPGKWPFYGSVVLQPKMPRWSRR